MPEVTGVSHVSLTVEDMARAKWFWTDVMGFEAAMEVSDFCLCIHRPTGLAISFKDHDGTVSGTFDETRIGLDHLALAVEDLANLGQWEEWLASQAIDRSPVEETELGHHLNLRAPDNIAVELFALKSDVAAALGLGVGGAV